MARSNRLRAIDAEGVPTGDSWGMVLRDLAFLALRWSLVGLVGLWLAELPAVRAHAPLSWLPRLSDKPLLREVPTAARVFGVKEVAAPSARAPVPGAPASPRQAGPRRPPPPQQLAGARPASYPSEVPEVIPRRVPAAAGLQRPPAARRPAGGGVRYGSRAVNSVPVRVVTVDLRDPDVVATIRLANDAERPNVAGDTRGAEPFPSLVRKLHAAAVINGTFFSKDAERRVMGNMVLNGALVKFSQWERGGTTFVLDAGNRPRMLTGEGGEAPWESAWLAVTAGPRLLRNGVTWCQPTEEGFKDPHVLGPAGRSALGFDAAGKRLFLVSFDAGVTLQREAEVMRAIGCSEAMNLDGGDSRGLAVAGRVVVSPGRPLTNVLAFYDRKHPAPKAVREAFEGHGKGWESLPSRP